MVGRKGGLIDTDISTHIDIDTLTYTHRHRDTYHRSYAGQERRTHRHRHKHTLSLSHTKIETHTTEVMLGRKGGLIDTDISTRTLTYTHRNRDTYHTRNAGQKRRACRHRH